MAIIAFLLAILFGATALSASGQRMVFAHYMLTNQDYQGDSSQEAKIAAYEREIQQAQAIGIDGFALNAGGWLHQPYYIEYAAQMFEAATRLHSGFKLMFSADMCCGNGSQDVEDMVRRFANNPRYSKVCFRYKSKIVLTTFAGNKEGTDFWRQIKSDLETGAHPSTAIESAVLADARGAPSNSSISIFLVPAFFWGGEVPARQAIQQGLDPWRSIVDGLFYWGIAGVPGSGGSLDQLHSSASYAAVAHRAGKIYMAPICPQFWGANANRYYEYSGASRMRALWMDAIRVTHPEWVEIITWNDFIEGTYVSPIDDPNKYPNANHLDTTGVPSTQLGYFHSHKGATALLKYFIQWYKTGTQPAITADSIYWFYRTQSAEHDAGIPPVAHKYGPVEDVIYVTTNLVSPADIQIASGKLQRSFSLPAGSTDIQMPFAVGNTPRFKLIRGGNVVVTGEGTDPIVALPRYNNYYYSTGDVIGTGEKHP